MVQIQSHVKANLIKGLVTNSKAHWCILLCSTLEKTFSQKFTNKGHWQRMQYCIPFVFFFFFHRISHWVIYVMVKKFFLSASQGCKSFQLQFHCFQQTLGSKSFISNEESHKGCMEFQTWMDTGFLNPTWVSDRYAEILKYEIQYETLKLEILLRCHVRNLYQNI